MQWEAWCPHRSHLGQLGRGLRKGLRQPLLLLLTPDLVWLRALSKGPPAAVECCVFDMMLGSKYTHTWWPKIQ